MSATPSPVVTGIEMKDDPGPSVPPLSEKERNEFLRKFIAEASDLASMKSEIVLRFAAVASVDEAGMKRGLVITRDMLDKMREGALNALSPDDDLDENNISEIRATSFGFKQLMSGRKVKSELKKLLPEYKPPKPKPKAKKPAKRTTTTRDDPRLVANKGARR